MKPVIVFTSGPEGLCPVQAEGTINGRPFYFRSRNESWSLQVAATNDGAPLDDAAWHHREAYPGTTPYAAGYAAKDECVAFIERVAQEWVYAEAEKVEAEKKKSV